VKAPEELRPIPGRVPPHDLDAEGAVIAAILLVASQFDLVIGIVNSLSFYSDANKMVFKAIEDLVSRNEPVDAMTVASELRRAGTLDRAGGSPYIAQLIGATPAVANVVTHAEIVRDKWQARQLILRGQRFIAEAYVGTDPSIEIIQRAETSLDELLSTGVGSELIAVGKIAADEVAIREELRRTGSTGRGTGSPTGYERLDRMCGGTHDTDLVIVAGRPGIGKTTFAMNLIANLARPSIGGPPEGAAFFSLEMPKEQVAIRFACAEQQVSVSNARRNSLRDDAWARFQRGAEELQRFPIWIDDAPTITVLEVRARVKKLMRDIASGKAGVPCSRLKLVAVDYLQLMQGIRQKGDTRESEVASLSRGLKALAKDLGLTVIGVSQLNRNPERGGKKDKRPELSDLRESGALEQDADVVWFVYRKAYYDREAATDDAELIVAKDRNGPTGTVPLRFVDEYVRFYERAEETYDDLTQNFAEDR
jgi:replicative DNA helicase